MNNRGKGGGLIGIVICILVFVFAIKVIPILAYLAALCFIFFMIAIIVQGFKGGRTAGDANKKTPVDVTTRGINSQGPKLQAEQHDKIVAANQNIVAGRTLVGRIGDADIRAAANNAYDKAEKLIKTFREQPDEIRRNSQFFNYYLPTINTILSKYLTLEKSEVVEKAESKDVVIPYLNQIAEALEKQYKASFDNELLDMSVEIEAMQIALKRDGLV